MRLCFYFFILLFSELSFGDSTYLAKFNSYIYWTENLPYQTDEEFTRFIKKNSPLNNKLREKWLFYLADQKDWRSFVKDYQPSSNTSLICYQQLALYNIDEIKKLRLTAKKLWLSPASQPSACQQLFMALIKERLISNDLIEQRIILALENSNPSLAYYLLTQYKPIQREKITLLKQIMKNPSAIMTLSLNPFNQELYLFGLNILLSRNTKKALNYWNNKKTKTMLSKKQQQQFIKKVANYKAKQFEQDYYFWFKQLSPAFYSDDLLESQIRAALANSDWPVVLTLIGFIQDKTKPEWKYWKARALAKLGKKDEAQKIFAHLAATRNYYGFLSSALLNKTFQFKNEIPVKSLELIKTYQSITQQIRDLYDAKKHNQASSLVNDFIMELPKQEKSALAYWLDHELGWSEKSMAIGNRFADLKNQLSLRFPMPYHQSISQYAKKFHLPMALIYAIIRQESGFTQQISSNAGAKGLMQLMPATASQVAKKEHISLINKNLIYSYDKNINIGVAYIKELSKQYKNHFLLMAAAYNAGPKHVNSWIKSKENLPIDVWIEILPWHETRNYLKNIIAFYVVYQYRLKHYASLNQFLRPFNTPISSYTREKSLEIFL